MAPLFPITTTDVRYNPCIFSVKEQVSGHVKIQVSDTYSLAATHTHTHTHTLPSNVDMNTENGKKAPTSNISWKNLTIMEAKLG